MNIKTLILIISILILCPGCNDAMNNNQSNYNEAQIKNEIGDLDKLISIPKNPVTIRWKEPDPKSKERAKIFAIAQFNENDYQFIVENSQSYEILEDRSLPRDIFDSWIPKEAMQSVKTDEVDGRVILKGIYSLKPNLFAQENLSPFIHGSITPLKNGYIFIYLYTM